MTKKLSALLFFFLALQLLVQNPLADLANPANTDIPHK